MGVGHTVGALRDFGNQSSASFMFAFDKLVKSGSVNVGENGLFVTMGPGAGLEMAMWTAGERFTDATEAATTAARWCLSKSFDSDGVRRMEQAKCSQRADA